MGSIVDMNYINDELLMIVDNPFIIGNPMDHFKGTFSHVAVYRMNNKLKT